MWKHKKDIFKLYLVLGFFKNHAINASNHFKDQRRIPNRLSRNLVAKISVITSRYSFIFVAKCNIKQLKQNHINNYKMKGMGSKLMPNI